MFLFLVVGILNLTPNVILGLGISVLREIGNIYLFILCLLLIILFYGMQKKDLQSSYFLATTILSLIGILTWLWANTSGTQNYWVVFNVDYPIVGDIFRSRGLSMGSSAWFWFLAPACLWSFTIFLKKQNSNYWIYFSILFLACFFTFSKSLILLLGGLVWIIINHFDLPKWLNGLTLGITSILFLFLTHFIPSKNSAYKSDSFIGSVFQSEPAIPINDNWILKPTSYVTVKKVGIKGIQSAPFLGIGSGQSEAFTADLQGKGEYPIYLANYSPHCTPLRAWEENGIFGFLGCMLLYITLIHFLVNNWALFQTSPALLAFALSFALLIVESLALDLISYRFIWVNLALFLSLFYRIKNKQLV